MYGPRRRASSSNAFFRLVTTELLLRRTFELSRLFLPMCSAPVDYERVDYLRHSPTHEKRIAPQNDPMIHISRWEAEAKERRELLSSLWRSCVQEEEDEEDRQSST